MPRRGRCEVEADGREPRAPVDGESGAPPADGPELVRALGRCGCGLAALEKDEKSGLDATILGGVG